MLLTVGAGKGVSRADRTPVVRGPGERTGDVHRDVVAGRMGTRRRRGDGPGMVDLYTIVAAGFRLGWRALALDVRTIDHTNIPREGPVILASNHVGYLDFCFVALAPPHPRRQVRFLARHDIWRRRIVGAAMDGMGQIPVDVHGDPTAALAMAEQRLREGEVIGVHPEGTISPSFVTREGRTGAVRLARATGAPIVPVAVWGSHRLLTKWRPVRLRRGVAVTVHYGEPFHPTAGTSLEAATADLMARIRTLLARAQAEYPQRPGPGPGEDWWIPAHLGGSAPTPAEADARVAAQMAERRARRAAERAAAGLDDDEPGSGAAAAS
jgi:1-acyl-sn-glycerol-3-phosphate acyltransferase